MALANKDFVPKKASSPPGWLGKYIKVIWGSELHPFLLVSPPQTRYVWSAQLLYTTYCNLARLITFNFITKNTDMRSHWGFSPLCLKVRNTSKAVKKQQLQGEPNLFVTMKVWNKQCVIFRNKTYWNPGIAFILICFTSDSSCALHFSFALQDCISLCFLSMGKDFHMTKALDIPWAKVQSYSTSEWPAMQFDAQLKKNRTGLEVCCKHPKDSLDACSPLRRTAPKLLPYALNQTYHHWPSLKPPSLH